MNITFEYNKYIQNGPSFIRTPSSLNIPTMFGTFDINSTIISPKDQFNWFEECAESLEVGWQAIVCGDIEYCRLLSYNLATKYIGNRRNVLWNRITTARYTEKIKSFYSLIVADALVTFDNQIDSVRFGNCFDLCSQYRGKSSVIVVCSGMTPQEVVDKCHLRPDYLWYLKPKQKKER